jgi:archaeal flagellar protein FlaG
MASDNSITEMIFFIASIIVAVSIAGTIIGVTGLMAEEMRTKGQSAVSEMGSSIVIVNDPRHVPYEDGVVTLYIKNTGEQTQFYQDLIIFIDGQYVEFDTELIESGSDNWVTGRVIEVTATIALEAGDHTAKAILGNGVSDTLDFRL